MCYFNFEKPSQILLKPYLDLAQPRQKSCDESRLLKKCVRVTFLSSWRTNFDCPVNKFPDKNPIISPPDGLAEKCGILPN